MKLRTCLALILAGTAAAGCATRQAPGTQADLDRQARSAMARMPPAQQPDTRLVQQADGRVSIVVTPPAPAPATLPAAPSRVAAAPAAPAAATAPPAAPPAAPAPSPQLQVQQAVESWRSAWERGDVEAYLRAYAPAFRGDAASHAAWERMRRARLGQPGITVELRGAQYEIGGNAATVRFEQHYRSARHADEGMKELKLRLVDGQWKIVGERWTRAPRSSNPAASPTRRRIGR